MAHSPIQLLQYTLQIADNALILGHRISEWCGRGPVLEQDIAITNTALDHLGQARSLYQYAAAIYNGLPAADKAVVFASPMLNAKLQAGESIDEDDLAYLRDVSDFRNVLLVEQPNKDWAYTIARSFLYDAFSFQLYTRLQQSSDVSLAAIAEKSLKEVTYHLRWSSEWVIRLGDGTEESHGRMQEALNEHWMYSLEATTANDTDKAMHTAGIGADLQDIQQAYLQHITGIITEATLTMPTQNWMQQGGKQGHHSEHLGYILAEMQYLQRAYPGMEW